MDDINRRSGRFQVHEKTRAPYDYASNGGSRVDGEKI